MSSPSTSTPSTISHASWAVFTISSRTHIAAPASHVFHTILSTSTWPEWNTFVPQCTIDAQPHPNAKNALAQTKQEENGGTLRVGTKMTLHVQMKPGPSLVKQKEVVTEISTPAASSSGSASQSGLQNADTLKTYRVMWCSCGMPTYMLRAERTQEITETGDGTCEYVTWEHFGGALARVVKAMYEGTLKAKFEDWGGDLKGWCERGGRDEQDGQDGMVG